jgi:hypothetical protein
MTKQHISNVTYVYTNDEEWVTTKCPYLRLLLSLQRFSGLAATMLLDPAEATAKSEPLTMGWWMNAARILADYDACAASAVDDLVEHHGDSRDLVSTIKDCLFKRFGPERSRALLYGLAIGEVVLSAFSRKIHVHRGPKRGIILYGSNRVNKINLGAISDAVAYDTAISVIIFLRAIQAHASSPQCTAMSIEQFSRQLLLVQLDEHNSNPMLKDATLRITRSLLTDASLEPTPHQCGLVEYRYREAMGNQALVKASNGDASAKARAVAEDWSERRDAVAIMRAPELNVEMIKVDQHD